MMSRGVVGNASKTGTVHLDFVNPRDFTEDRHRSVDDTPYGGGPGMVMTAEPLLRAIESVQSSSPDVWRLALTPGGTPLKQSKVQELSGKSHLVLVCGRYEGMDQRVLDIAIDEEISLGDYVLSGGELAAGVIVDTVSRYVPGVLGEFTSLEEESFCDGLVEYPHYTRPHTVRGHEVPSVLQSGNHEQIRQWRRQQSLHRTAVRRPDLWGQYRPKVGDASLIERAQLNMAGRTYVGLVHFPVYNRENEIVTSSITTLDIHDLARSTATYGLAGYYVVTPIAAQRAKVDQIVDAWFGQEETEPEEALRDSRTRALTLVRTAASIDMAIASIRANHDEKPLVVVTSANPAPQLSPVSVLELRRKCIPENSPVLLLFGTGWGLESGVLAQADVLLEPISGSGPYNHLSVRSAAAIVLDRLFGKNRM